jgi:NADH:ubiquinone oxidoreductase subunit 5 (subunit L)/multisubunit Na+/H+ antiporter MnhA subunit
MYLTIVFLTLISSLTVGFFGRFFGFYGAALLSSSCLIITFFVSMFIFYEVAFLGCFSYIKLISWVSSEALNVDWGFMFDSLTAVMCCVVTFISCLVHFYSTEYEREVYRALSCFFCAT